MSKCSHHRCTGSHSSNDWRNMCPGGRQRKRFRQAQWVRRKYETNYHWAERKRDANRTYKSSAAGIISACGSTTRARLAALEATLSELNLTIAPVTSVSHPISERYE